MRTVVIQSFRSENIPRWIQRCLDSVEAWAASRGFDYRLVDDSCFALCGEAYLARVGRNLRAMVNLSRLELVKEAHNQGYDRAIWLDADVLVFHPELFTIDIVERYAFARETWITHHDGRWNHYSNVNNCAFVCMKGEPDLDALIQFTRHIGVHRKIEKSLQTGTYLLTGLQSSLAFETLDNVGLFSNHVVKAIAADAQEPMTLQALAHGTPVFAANLCASDRDPPMVSEAEAEIVIDRLLVSKGDIINQRLLQSPNNVLHSRPKPGMVALFPHGQLVRLQFKQKHGYEPNLADPQTYNERVAARKLTLTDPIYRDTADKYAVRKFVAERVGEQVLIPLLQVCDRAEDVDLDGLPTPFILKPTHGSGWTEIVRDRSMIDREAVRAKMRKWLRTNFFGSYFEIHYRDIPPRIVAEQLLQTADGKPPEDFRFHVFHGRVRIVSNSENMRTPQARMARYDPLWRRLAVRGHRPQAADRSPPARLSQMIEIAERLGRDFELVRVDLYCLEDKIYFGEITHTPTGGLTEFKPRDFDLALGRIAATGEPIPEQYYAKGKIVSPAPALVNANAPSEEAPLPPLQWRGFNRRLLQFNALSSFKLPVVAADSRRVNQNLSPNLAPVRRTINPTIEIGSDPKRQREPLVSCLMLTEGGRLNQTRFAINAYRKQTWRRRELVIVDTGEGGQLIEIVEATGDPSIRVVLTEADASQARALGLAEAKGTHVCIWDETSLYHPARLEAQVAVLKAAGAKANALDATLAWAPVDRRLLLVGRGAHDRTLLCEKATLRDPVAFEWLRGAAGADGLLRSIAASYLDLPELCILLRDGDEGEGRGAVEIPGYNVALEQISRCFPVQELLRSFRRAPGSLLSSLAGEAAG